MYLFANMAGDMQNGMRDISQACTDARKAGSFEIMYAATVQGGQEKHHHPRSRVVQHELQAVEIIRVERKQISENVKKYTSIMVKESRR